jgi:transcriptional regulator with XRE-family HTH domain
MLSEKIRSLMEEKQVTQKQMSKELGLAQQTISGYLAGIRTPRFDTLCRMAKVLNVSVDYFNETNKIASDTPKNPTQVKNGEAS